MRSPLLFFAGFLSVIALGGCQHVESTGIYERMFFGPDLFDAYSSCVFAGIDLDQVFSSAGIAQAYAPAKEAASLDGEAAGRRRDCMLDLGWKELPALRARATRGQTYALQPRL